MKKITILFMLCLLVLSACSAKEEHVHPPQPISVMMSITPETISAGEEVTFSVTVKQGEELVEDANEVQFEIWQDGSEDHQFVYAEHQGDGVYSVVQSFEQTGKYWVMYHVTARDFHDMRKQEFQVQ